MKPPYLNLTGEKLLRSIRRTEIIRIILNSLLLLFFTVFFSYIGYELIRTLPDSWFFLFTAPAWILAFWFPIKAIKRHTLAARSGSLNDVFAKYGSPEEIAEVLADPENMHMLKCRNLFFTKAYFMKRGDYLTYIPLREIAHISVSRTYGKHAHLVMTVQPRDGESRRYQVSQPLMLASLSRQIEMLSEDLKNHMTFYAPECSITSAPW